MLGGPTDRAGRVEVTPELTLPEDPRVYVVGDLAAVTQDGQPVPGLAPAAMQMGRCAARNILRRFHGKPVEPFHYTDKGSFAVIGRGAAVGSIFSKLEVHGVLAWLIWATVHLLYLVGFRSRIAVMFTWLYSYLTWRRVARLITFTPWLRRREALAVPLRGPAIGPGSLPVGAASPAPVHASPER
jgi:NADH dehydrogenase